MPRHRNWSTVNQMLRLPRLRCSSWKRSNRVKSNGLNVILNWNMKNWSQCTELHRAPSRTSRLRRRWTVCRPIWNTSIEYMTWRDRSSSSMQKKRQMRRRRRGAWQIRKSWRPRTNRRSRPWRWKSSQRRKRSGGCRPSTLRRIENARSRRWRMRSYRGNWRKWASRLKRSLSDVCLSRERRKPIGSEGLIRYRGSKISSTSSSKRE